MASNPRKQSVLFRTSAATDVQYSGGEVLIAGLKGVLRKDITRIRQTKYRAEVAQVVTVSTSAAPTASTVYQVAITDLLRVEAGYQELPKVYKYTTPAVITDLGATAALQREAINAVLIAAINADASNHAVADTSGSGNGFTVTDDGGYFPVWSQTMTNIKGVNAVYTITNQDGSGFASNLASVTTAGVYQSGTGAILASQAPVVDAVYGNLISGVLNAPPMTSAATPLPAVSGQNYDTFTIESMYAVDAIQATGQFAYIERVQYIFVDNGTGSATTNLAGFKAFERVMHKLMVSTYSQDPCTVQQWFDAPIAFQGPLGAAPAGTADVLQWILSPTGSLNWTNIGTQTIVAPVLDDTGLLIDQDDTTTEGAHYSANQQVLGDQSFVVGKTAFSVTARVVAGDWTDTQFMVGFRKKAVYAADYNNYTDLAAIGGGAADGDSITTQGILNNAATVATDSGVNFADAVSMLLQVRVAIDGTVSAYYASASGGWVSAPIYSAGTTTLIFDAGDEMIPFFQHVNIGGGNPAVSIGEFFAVATDRLVA